MNRAHSDIVPFGKLDRASHLAAARYEEKQILEHTTMALKLAFATSVAGAHSRTTREARIRGLARACARALFNISRSGKSKETARDDLAGLQVIFDDEMTWLHDELQTLIKAASDAPQEYSETLTQEAQ